MFVIVAVKAVLGVEKMNEYQKAYDRLAFNFGLDCLDEKLYPEEVEDFELFRELVERETPKKIQFNVPQQPFLRKKYGKNARYDGICPNCHKSVYPGYKYCTNCGQKLDWGEKDD